MPAVFCALPCRQFARRICIASVRVLTNHSSSLIGYALDVHSVQKTCVHITKRTIDPKAYGKIGKDFLDDARVGKEVW